MIYLDNAAATRPLPCAIEAMNAVLQVSANPNSSHAAGQDARTTLEDARARIARCIGARPDEIHFTPSATAACQWAMETLSQNCAVTQVSAVEHHAVLDFPVRTNAALDRRGIAQMLANNETGELFVPKRENKTDLLFTDATAAMGHIPIDVKALGVDHLAAGGHKFGAPCGIGFLYARHGAPLAEQRFGTPPVALACAMASALEWHTEHMEENARKVHSCADAFYDVITRRTECYHLNLASNRLPHILNVSFDGVDGKALALLCSKRGVMISAGAACTSGNNEPSHVIMSMYHDEARARSAVRISFSHENTAEEAEQAAKIIAECVEQLRAIS